MAANGCVPITEYIGAFISRRWIPRTGLLDQRNVGVVAIVLVVIITVPVNHYYYNDYYQYNDSFDPSGNLLITMDYY